MVVSEAGKIDFLLKKNGCLMVEYRDPSPDFLPLYEFQALLKAENFIHAVKKGILPKDGETFFLIHSMREHPKELVNFLSKHQFGVHKQGDSGDEKTIIPEKPLSISTGSLSVSDSELTALAEKCSALFVSLMKKSSLNFDYSLDSLVSLDSLIKSQTKHLQEDLTGKDLIVMAGCYVGEVIRREAKKDKLPSNWTLLAGMGEYPAILSVAETKANPIGKVNKLAHAVSGEETEYFAKVILKYARKEIK